MEGIIDEEVAVTIDTMPHDPMHDLLAKVAYVFASNDSVIYRQIATDSLYCRLCFSETDLTSDRPYMLTMDQFFPHVKKLRENKGIMNALKSKEFIIEETPGDHRSDFIILLSIRSTEKAGEGRQAGVYVKMIDGQLKFSGIETLP